MFKRLIETIVLWAVARRDRREAERVKALYAATLPGALEDTSKPSSSWYDDYDKVEVPEIGKPQSPPCDTNVEPSPVRHCACAVSKMRYPDRFSYGSVLPTCQL